MGLPINSADIILKDGTIQHVGEGYYLTKIQGMELAEGINAMKAEIEKLQLTSNAYMEAYKREKELNNQMASLYKEQAMLYKARIENTEKLISLTQTKYDLMRVQNKKLEHEVKIYRMTNIITAILLIGALL